MATIYLTDGTTIEAESTTHDGKRLYYKGADGVQSVLEDDEYTRVED